MSPELDRALDSIINCFAGGDAGMSFVKFRILLKELDAKAQDGDAAAKQLLRTVFHMQKLIDFANTRINL